MNSNIFLCMTHGSGMLGRTAGLSVGLILGTVLWTSLCYPTLHWCVEGASMSTSISPTIQLRKPELHPSSNSNALRSIQFSNLRLFTGDPLFNAKIKVNWLYGFVCFAMYIIAFMTKGCSV